MSGSRPAGPRQRAAYRRYIREHHPDAGGDPDAFVTGLARLRDTFGSERGPGAAEDLARYDAPVEFVSSAVRRQRQVRRLWRLLRRGRAPSRVR